MAAERPSPATGSRCRPTALPGTTWSSIRALQRPATHIQGWRREAPGTTGFLPSTPPAPARRRTPTPPPLRLRLQPSPVRRRACQRPRTARRRLTCPGPRRPAMTAVPSIAGYKYRGLDGRLVLERPRCQHRLYNNQLLTHRADGREHEALQGLCHQLRRHGLGVEHRLGYHQASACLGWDLHCGLDSRARRTLRISRHVHGVFGRC